MTELATTDAERLTELESTIERGLSTFVDVGNALAEVRDSGLYKNVLGFTRFEDYCSERWSLSQSRAYQMIDAAQVASVVSTIVEPVEALPVESQLRELAPLKEDERQVVEAWREAKEAAQVAGTKITASVVRNAVQKRVARIEREKVAAEIRERPIEPTTTTDDVEIHHGDFREVFRDQDFSGGVIISDPPYPREYLPLYADLASWSTFWGCERMILMVGQSIMPEVLSSVVGVNETGMTPWEYHWSSAYLTIGPATRIWDRKVSTSWKPILSFGRNDCDWPNLTTDIFRSSGDDKNHHYWGQNENGMAALVEAFTEPGDLVIDPFLGGGTTAIVCRELGRRFVGCDVDAAAVHATRERLAR